MRVDQPGLKKDIISRYLQDRVGVEMFAAIHRNKESLQFSSH